MNDTEIPERVRTVMRQQCRERGYAAPADVLMDLGVLAKPDYLRWRNGKVDYLERVCRCNLKKLSNIMKAMRITAREMELKPSFTYYRQWGKKGSPKQLRFSKSGALDIEKNYATHYVVPKQKKSKPDETPAEKQKQAVPPMKKQKTKKNQNKPGDYSWQFLFRLPILERGITIYFNQGISSYTEREDSISAVVEGTRSYQVDVQLINGLPDTMSCTCPYAGKGTLCKHMAAVLCRHFDYPLLDEPRDAADAAAAELSTLADAYTNRDGEIDCEDGQEFITEFCSYLQGEVMSLLNQSEITSANEVIKCGYMLIATVVMNGSLGEHSTGFECCRKLWKKVLHQGTDAMEKDLYRWFQTIRKADCYRYCAFEADEMLLDLFRLPELIQQNCRVLEEELVTCELERYGLDETLRQYMKQLKKLGMTAKEIRIHCKHFETCKAYQDMFTETAN